MPRVPGCDAVYEVADQWRERCLAGDGSLLWPDLAERTWTIENIERAKSGIASLPKSTHPAILERFQQEPESVRRIVADLLAVWPLMISWLIGQTRLYWVNSIAPNPPDPGMLELYSRAISTHMGGIDGGNHNTRKNAQLLLYLKFASRLKTDSISPWDEKRCHDLAFSLTLGISASDQAPNMLLHILFPDAYEAVTLASQKKAILGAFGITPGPESQLDSQLGDIREKVTQTIGRSNFHYFEDDVLRLWNRPEVSKTRSDATAGIGTTDPPIETKADQPSDLSLLSNLDTEMLREINTVLRDKKQIILEGPPGSGKTYVARLFARYLAGLPLEGGTDERVEIVQFHQSYGYEDFVAGIRPVTNPDSGQLTYETRPGIFVEMCQRALANPDDTFVLIIDEINRGNLSRIFGELLYGLEYRDQPVRMQYPVTIDGVEQQHLTIPENLLLIGTMNSTDRSLAMIDYALRRRFYFWRLMPVEENDAPVLRRWLESRAVDPAERQELLSAFIALNTAISQELGPDYQIGHSYFMLDDGELGNPDALDRVWTYAIEPLLREYFHTRRDVESQLARFRNLFFGPPATALDDLDMDELAL